MSKTPVSRLRAFVSAAAMIATLPFLTGCPLLVVGAASAGGGYATLGQERSAQDQVRDVATRSLVSQSWNEYSPDLPHNLDANVYEGRVLITGRLANEQLRQEAVQRAWKVEGVKEVYDEIEVGPDTHFSDEARDTVISTRLKNDLVWDGQVKSINYTIKTENGTVYIIGSARSKDELERVTGYARNIPNVRRVVSYVRVRVGEPVAAQAANNPAPVVQPAPSAANTAPTALTAPSAPAESPTQRSTIEVTPLR